MTIVAIVQSLSAVLVPLISPYPIVTIVVIEKYSAFTYWIT